MQASPQFRASSMGAPTTYGAGAAAGAAGAAAFGAGAAYGGAMPPVSQPKNDNRPAPAQQSMPAAYAQAGGIPQAQAVAMPVQQPIQIRCGACGNIFGSPQAGVTVACPHCSAHNVVPPSAGMQMQQMQMMGAPGMYGGGPGMYGPGGPGMYGGGPGMYGPQGQYGNPNQRNNNAGLGMAAAGGAGLLGGMLMADMIL
eukprot:gnl/TRDRNA2_/TRDRNA2_83736_c0_seq1.p1 gnl/TRDRNA2_/TRDRNA2_83736_c0~~gnl/TRDRNA2_/TRDRNA2_83736_c0_seq1.p1  ORF type:complete len:198 (+),score=34.04 gnl/TRDRNA2_/TRDRNA2_83736_c0_seq1:3-596(+)